MKFLHLTYHFEFTAAIEKILDKHGVKNFSRYPMMEGKDIDGKHFGTQVFPGNNSVVQAEIADEKVEPLLEELRTWRDAKKVHNHIRAIILPVEETL
jgi:hypothetical protein